MNTHIQNHQESHWEPQRRHSLPDVPGPDLDFARDTHHIPNETEAHTAVSETVCKKPSTSRTKPGLAELGHPAPGHPGEGQRVCDVTVSWHQRTASSVEGGVHVSRGEACVRTCCGGLEGRLGSH